MKIILVSTLSIIMILLPVSCVGVNSDTDTQGVQRLHIPLDSMEYAIYDRIDTLHEYTMLVYMNVDMCMECSMKQIPMYESFVQERGFRLFTILNVSKDHIRHLKYLIRSLRAKQTLSIDSTNVFIRQNPMLDEYDTQVFLLDKDHNVVIEGNPFLNDKTMKEYDRYAEE